jgi:20S proteasome alpha/beta subunit
MIPRKPFLRRPAPYPKRLERRKPPMTIAAGFFCQDGIVICADSEVSTDFEKFDESKIFTQNPDGAGDAPTVVFAGSGWLDFVKMTVDKVRNESAFVTHGYEVEEILEKTILNVHRKHIRYYPVEPKPFFSLLVGIRDQNSLSLFLTAGTAVNRVPEYACIGVGDTLAHYLSRGLTPQRESSQEAALLAVQILDQVKKNVPGCGGQFSEILILPKQGPVSRISPGKLLDIEYRTHDLGRILKPLLMSFANPTIADSEFESSLSEFEEQCRRLREESNVRMDRARKKS